MKTIRIIFITISLIALLFGRAKGDEINFLRVDSEQELNAALEEAKHEHKLVFVDFTADWCSWCVHMDNTTFKDDEVSEFMNTEFINLKIDGTTLFGETKGTEFGVEAYPTFLILSYTGEIIARESGYKEAHELLEICSNYNTNFNNYRTLSTKYEEDPGDVNLLYKYAQVLYKMDMTEKGRRIAESYFGKIGEVDISDTSNWNLISLYYLDKEDEYLNQVLDNYLVYEKIIGFEEVSLYFYNAFAHNYTEALNRQDEGYLNFSLRLVDGIASSFLPYGPEEFKNLSRIYFFETAEDWTSYKTMVVNYMEKYTAGVEETINFIINFYLHIEESVALQKANRWAKELVEQEENAVHYIVLACSYYKLGDSVNISRSLRLAGELAQSQEEEELVAEYRTKLGM